MHALLTEKKTQFEAAIENLHKELSVLRTGRATPALVEDIQVSAYDSVMEIKGLSSISAQDAKTLIITPWDKSMLQAMEKGVRDADIGLSPIVDGDHIRVVMPQMTEENRKKMVKVVKEKLKTRGLELKACVRV